MLVEEYPDKISWSRHWLVWLCWWSAVCSRERNKEAENENERGRETQAYGRENRQVREEREE